MDLWSEGVILLGVYGEKRAGCWLLVNGGSAAIVEMPPYNPGQFSPTIAAQIECEQRDITIEHLLCTHAHEDHASFDTLKEFHKAFPGARISLQSGFKTELPHNLQANWFEERLSLDIAGEPLHLIHAPKHSWTDTMIVFRGVMITGDWEMNTIHSVYDDDAHHCVPKKTKLQSIENLKRFTIDTGYRVHKIFSSHANDRRDDVDFIELMEDTKADRRFW
jgi:glyoxylase-like metal-dependent hydrolase (beta-lactamase superfamily II)